MFTHERDGLIYKTYNLFSTIHVYPDTCKTIKSDNFFLIFYKHFPNFVLISAKNKTM